MLALILAEVGKAIWTAFRGNLHGTLILAIYSQDSGTHIIKTCQIEG